jgi:hypothetical protein
LERDSGNRTIFFPGWHVLLQEKAAGIQPACCFLPADRSAQISAVGARLGYLTSHQPVSGFLAAELEGR